MIHRKTSVWAVFGLFVLSAALSAQPGPLGAGVGPGVGPGPGDHTFRFIGADFGFGGGPAVKGAPYSAEAVTKIVQTLSDGNKISRENTAVIHRDSEGRTRREQTLGALGPWASAGDEPPRMIFINDPVENVHYVLNAQDKTAQKMQLPSFAWKEGEDPAQVEHVEGVFVEGEPAAGATAGVAIAAPQHRIRAGSFGAIAARRLRQEPATESLGARVIEGVQAEGTRTTITIPAGEIGNERAIEIVSERWFSPELQVVVMSTRSDPRMGETTYRMTNIQRVEPLLSLFQVPADYTVQEGPQFFNRAIRGREVTAPAPNSGKQ